MQGRPKNQITKVCLFCEKEFYGFFHKRRMCCTTKCYDAFRYSGKTKKEIDLERSKKHPLLISKGAKTRKGEVRKCFTCGTEKYIRPCFLKFKRSFCSKDCLRKQGGFSLNCDVCGKNFRCSPADIKWRNRKGCSVKCRSIRQTEKAKENRIKNGFTKHQIDRCIRESKEAKAWRTAVFKRDNYTCQFCFKRGGYLEADHIKPFAFFPELRFELSNGRTLCRSCHNKTKMYYKKMRELYGKKEVSSKT